MKYINSLPEKLKQIHNPPEKLYFKGDLELLKKTSIAIVGTRRNSDYGEAVTEKIVSGLSMFDITIISGLAKGIDTIAHKCALKNKIPTIAVLGSGFMDIYPKVNERLAKEIEEKGLLLSEYSPETPPLPHHFPERNRIVSGLSDAVLVIEAPVKSGALITAYLALEQGKDIFVTPGDIDRQNSSGILKLLQKGAAYPISSAQEIIETMSLPKKIAQQSLFSKEPPKLILDENEVKILGTLSKTRAKAFEIIQNKTCLNTQILLVTLSLLEIKGLIKIKEGEYLLATGLN